MMQDNTARNSAPRPGSSINMITRKSRAVQPVLNGRNLPWPNMIEPRKARTMGGLDIEQWRNALGLDKFQAQYALGFRSTTLYNREIGRAVLPITTEILIRLYDELPTPPPWTRFTFAQLFDLMHSKYLAVFGGRDLQRAQVDLGARFTIMFGRSNTRAYAWLRRAAEGSKLSSSSYADVESILAKLTAFDNPAEVFERLAKFSLKLRGVDVDELFPIPTLENPPQRKSPGRKPGQKVAAKQGAPVKKAPAGTKAEAPVSNARSNKAAAKVVAKKAAVRDALSGAAKSRAGHKAAAPKKAERSNRAGAQAQA